MHPVTQPPGPQQPPPPTVLPGCQGTKGTLHCIHLTSAGPTPFLSTNQTSAPCPESNTVQKQEMGVTSCGFHSNVHFRRIMAGVQTRSLHSVITPNNPRMDPLDLIFFELWCLGAKARA